jgi:hypothetical protein
MLHLIPLREAAKLKASIEKKTAAESGGQDGLAKTMV